MTCPPAAKERSEHAHQIVPIYRPSCLLPSRCFAVIHRTPARLPRLRDFSTLREIASYSNSPLRACHSATSDRAPTAPWTSMHPRYGDRCCQIPPVIRFITLIPPISCQHIWHIRHLPSHSIFVRVLPFRLLLMARHDLFC